MLHWIFRWTLACSLINIIFKCINIEWTPSYITTDIKTNSPCIILKPLQCLRGGGAVKWNSLHRMWQFSSWLLTLTKAAVFLEWLPLTIFLVSMESWFTLCNTQNSHLSYHSIKGNSQTIDPTLPLLNEIPFKTV